MAGIRAADLQYVLNVIPLSDYQKAFALDETFINLIGGLKPGPGRLQIPFHHAGNTTAGSFIEGDDLSTAGKQSRRLLSFDYKRIYVTAGVDGLQEAIANNGGIVKINDLLNLEVMQAVEDLLDELNTQTLSDGTGNSSADVDGLQFQIADDNTWGGLARASYAWLQSYVNDNGGANRALTEALMRTMHNTAVDTRKAKYNAIFCGSDLYDAYEDLMGDRKRYIDMKVGDISFKGLSFKQRPLINIPGFAANRMDFVRRGDFSLKYLPIQSIDNKNRIVKGPFKVEEVASNSDDTYFNIIMYPQLMCLNPWKQLSLQDVE